MSIELNLNEICRGCNNMNGCLVKYHKPFAGECICNTCLVKAMCQKMCNKRKILYALIPDEDKIRLHDEFKRLEIYNIETNKNHFDTTRI